MFRKAYYNKVISWGDGMNEIKFFLGASNARKYVSYFSESYVPTEFGKYFILKGGPGTGKSTFMKKTASEIEKEGFTVHRIFCSSDPSSLDAVLFPELNAGIFDGTAPHVMDPVLPGICEEMINLGACWDSSVLRKNKDSLARLSLYNSQLHKKASDYLFVASRFDKENLHTAARALDGEKLDRYITRLCAREIGITEKKGGGKLKKCFLSAVTPEGIKVHYDTVVSLAERIIVINDEFSCVAPLIVGSFCSYALKNGLDVIACFCPLFPEEKIEHIFIPKLSLCIFSSNQYHSAPKEFGRQIHGARFLDTKILALKRESIDFNKKAKSELIDEAVKKLKTAKLIHDEMENYYIGAINFDEVEKIRKETVLKIFALN